MPNITKSINDDLLDLIEPFLDEATESIAREMFEAALPDIVKDLIY